MRDKVTYSPHGDDRGDIQVLSGRMEGTRVTINSGETVILGKSKDMAYIIFDDSYTKVSRIHCTITYDGAADKFMVVDSSLNGTYYEDGMKLKKNARTPVERGTVLKLADDNCKIKLM